MTPAGNTIADVWTVELAAALGGSLATATTEFSESRVLLVVVELNDGTFGVGEAGVGHTGQAARTIPALRCLIEGPYRSLLIGQQLNLTVLRGRLESAFKLEIRGLGAAALSGVDIALWDLLAKTLDRPLCEVLGGGRTGVDVYATGGQYRSATAGWSLEKEVRGYVQSGFTAVKMKVGKASASVDLERVRAVRAVLGPDIALAVDASYGFTPKQALAFARLIEPFRIDFIEAPVALGDIEGLAEVRRGSSIPIAGNEFASTVAAFKELIAHRCVDYVQPSLIMCGGITEAARIAALAGAAGLPVTLQAAGSIISTLASVHFAAANSAVVSCEVNQVHSGLGSGLSAEGLPVRQGKVKPPSAPGLGVTASLAELRELRGQ